MTTHIFTGPTLSASVTQALCPQALVHGPISHLDVLRLDIQPGDLIGIIDGFFYQNAPVRHKELLWLINHGVTVVGAASMGALRAAELYRHGMHGRGRIFDMYRSGVLVADDEVAVAHAGSEDEYRASSDALVNIRIATSRGVTSGILEPDSREAIVAAAADMFFADRSLRRAVNVCVASRAIRRAAAARFLDWAAHYPWNLKAEDAAEMITAISAGEIPAVFDRPGLPDRPAGPQTAGADLGAWLTRTQMLTGGSAHASRDSAEDVMRLFAIDADDMIVALGVRRLARMAAEHHARSDCHPGGAPEPEDAQALAVGYCRRRGLAGPGGLRSAAVARMLNPREIDELAEADCQFLAAARIAASAAPQVCEVLAGVSSPCRNPPDAAIAFAARAADFNAHLAEQAPHYRPDHIAENTVVGFYRQVWSRSRYEQIMDADQFAVEVRRRGFPTLRAFFGTARPYLPYAHDQGPPEVRWGGQNSPGSPLAQRPMCRPHGFVAQ